MIRVLVSEYDDLEYCDVTSMLSWSRDIIGDVTNRRVIGTFLQAPVWLEPLNRLVSEIFSIKFADKQTQTHTDTSNDNKGRLKLAAREPVNKTNWTGQDDDSV